MEKLKEKVIKAFCNSCKRRTEFEFYKTQERDGFPLFDLYNCKSCHTTRCFNETEYWRGR